ncbi:MAG: arylamine N-acetyltransferase [Acidobacteriota bacterium]
MIDVQDAVADRYLRVLGITYTPVSYDGLCEVVRQHLVRVPFENISKLRLFAREGAGRPITLPEFLDGIEREDLGGTCYSSNPFLAALLAALGYDAALLGADMSTPDVHTSIRVRLDGREYHVDVGYAGPFAVPIPLDRLPYRIPLGGCLYVFDRARGGHEMTIFAGGEKRHGYVVHQPPRAPSFFHQTIVGSFERGRTFMRCLRVTRFFDDGEAVELRNRKLLRLSREGSSEQQIDTLDELQRAVSDEFRMPRCRIEEAVATLEQLNGREFFGAERWLDSTEGPD